MFPLLLPSSLNTNMQLLQAPAVVEKAPVVLGKTKSGRVTKSSAPQATKKAGAKKPAAKKAAAPKKAATPKKA
jgi:histone H1/5